MSRWLGRCVSIACTSAPWSTSRRTISEPTPDDAPATIPRLPAYPSTSCMGAPLLLDRDRLLGAVLRAELRVLGELTVDVGDEDLAVTEVVGAEHVRGECVAPAVTGAE